ncbi:MAG: hypothetical protein K0R80_2911 [Clostridia bacterium]|jgi:hypothetical protein|nr:hypothetical protein [Clostridia bacterium]
MIKYIEYDIATKTVARIAENPIVARAGCEVCTSENLNVGDEELNLINIQEINAETQELISFTQVLAPPSITFMIRENKALRQQIELIQPAIDDLILNSGGGF